MSKNMTPSQAAEASNIIVRTVPKLDRRREPQQVLDDVGRNTQYADESVVATMPSNGAGVEEDVQVEFFKLGRHVNDDELQCELDKRGLTSDPYAQVAVNKADQAFADEHPNGTHWKDADDKWCFAVFYLNDDGERSVNAYRGGTWDEDWWFAGVRKSVHQSEA